jgi:hypothetical protein
VTPGPTQYTDSHDYLWSTPARLYAVRGWVFCAWRAAGFWAVPSLRTFQPTTHIIQRPQPTHPPKQVLDGTLKAWEAMNAAASDRMGSSAEGSGVPRKIRAMREIRDEIRRKYL